LYDGLLENIGGIKIANNNFGNVYHLYVIRTEKRDGLMEYLKEKGIGTLIHYPIPLHLQKAFSYLGFNEGDFPTAERFSREILSLPMFPELSEEEVKRVCREIENYFA